MGGQHSGKVMNVQVSLSIASEPTVNARLKKTELNLFFNLSIVMREL